MFFPLGDCYSIDNMLKEKTKFKNKKNKGYLTVTGGTIALLLQISFLYGFSAIHKSGAEWRSEYTATFYALQLDYFRTPIGAFFLNFPNLLKFLTWAVLLVKNIFLCGRYLK